MVLLGLLGLLWDLLGFRSLNVAAFGYMGVLLLPSFRYLIDFIKSLLVGLLIVSCFRRESYSSSNLWICLRLSLVCMYLGQVLYSKGGVPPVVYIFFGVGCSVENG